jgi:translocation and assembly module TamB
VLYDQPWIRADVQLAQTHLRGVNLIAGHAKLEYQNGRGTAQFLAEGTSGVPFRIVGNTQLEPKVWHTALAGRLRGIEFKTRMPARIVSSQRGYELLATEVEFGEGNLRLAGEYGTGLTIKSRLDRLDLALLNAFLPGYGINGQATGSLDFSQQSPDAFPRAEARLSIANFTSRTANFRSLPVDLNLIGNLDHDRSELRAIFRQHGKMIGRMVATLRPVDQHSKDLVEWLGTAPLSGGIRYNGPAETLWSLIGQRNQSLSGSIAIGVDFNGLLRKPQLSGIVSGTSLAYQNETYGTKLRDLAIFGRFYGDRLQVERFSATAGSGRVVGEGFLSLSSASGYPVDISLNLDNAQLVRSDALSSAASGLLRLTKVAGSSAILSGTLRLPRTRYTIARPGRVGLPELTGVRFKQSGDHSRLTDNEQTATASNLLGNLSLDIALSTSNQFYVGGMGLDSEWDANMRIIGTASDPRLTGEVALLRGNLDFAGRRFDLQQGRVLFTGGSAIDPQIQLSATEEIDGVAVTVAASGKALNPQITFSSRPSLPPDEVLSRILFGNSVGQLSPLEAVQLAASLNALRASGNSMFPLGKLSAATSLARLRILAPDESTGRGTAISAGRYITNKIYVELITDARGFTATQLEISLSPTLSVLSQAGGVGASNLNLRYRKRY